ncbi:hypothetical protein AB0929_09440 [Streptomyces massasporeus]|uniref:hypothetical protein n=1 Tax=Streptomyces massasporeus TaxID=67324 RepID=UPI0034518641
MNDDWSDKDTEDLVADRLRFIGVLLEEDTETTARAEEPATVTGPPREPVAVGARRWSGRMTAGVLGLAAVVTGVVFAALWAPWSPDEEAESKPDQSGIVACAKLVVEGTVAGTDLAGPGEVGVRLDVERYVKPSKGPDEVRFVVPRADGAAYQTGSRVLVAVSRFDDEVPLLFTGSDISPTEEWMTAEANRADAPACPGRG